MLEGDLKDLNKYPLGKIFFDLICENIGRLGIRGENYHQMEFPKERFYSNNPTLAPQLEEEALKRLNGTKVAFPTDEINWAIRAASRNYSNMFK